MVGAPLPSPSGMCYSAAMTDAQIRKFLEAVSRGWSISRACRSAGCGLGAPYDLRKRDPLFADSWRTAYEAGTDRFEDAAADRALNGTVKGIWYQGQLVGYEIRYDNRLLLDVLAARRPVKWRHFDVAAGESGDAPSVRGEDVLSLLEQKLAGLEARSEQHLVEDGT